jgi:hypothetical protein
LRREASRLNERGRELSDRGDFEGAMSAYRAATTADEGWSVPWYNLGLVHKYRCEWAESVRCNRAAVLRDPSDRDAWWNLGIAATALEDWPQAREAWSRCGVTLPEGEGPIRGNYGLTPVRLDPRARGEVVWCERIDPARAVIRNVPLPESGYRFGDVMLHDGARNGTRLLEGREVPVFDALLRLSESDFHTYILDLPDSTPSQRALLAELAFTRGLAAEDWSESLRFICRSCSEGRVHERHDSELGGVRPELAVAAAARSAEEVERLLEEWRRESGYGGYAGFTRASGDL